MGQGAPAGVAQQFVQAYFRNGFNTLTSATPQGSVRSFGSGGYLQEFSDAKKTSGVTFALIKGGDATDPVFQMYPAMYSYYTSVGVSNAGLPTTDTSGCSALGSPTSFCTYQLFESTYALFVYTSSLTGSENRGSYTVKETMYTRWASLGSITGIGAATSAETSITSKTGITATAQQFAVGALYNITSGAFSGRVFPVRGKAFTLYSTLGLHNGPLGIPLSDELAAPGGKTRQNFEGGQIEYSNTTDPIVRPAVGGVQLNASSSDVTRLNLGDTVTLRAAVVATTGESLTDREITWTTSNSRVVSVTPAAGGATAALKAVGGGTAVITAVSEGKASDRVTIFVSAPCCQIGEGAPTAAIQQAFQDVVARQRLSIKLPAASPVARIGLGHAQELLSADGTQRYLLCRSDRSPGVFVVSGDLLRAYESEGGPGGKLAYPASDATTGGRQIFEGGILAGNPIFIVTGAIAARWAALGYEAGALGPPVSAPQTALSFRGVSGTLQSFRGGALVSAAGGQTIVVAGLILARYLATGGAGGQLGLPLGEEYARQGNRRQDFEGGSLEYAPGDAEARIEEQERRPQITVTPPRVTAGGRVRIAVGGFPSQAAVRVTLTGESAGGPFTVQTQNGSYVWEAPVPRNAPTGFVTIRAQEVDGAGTAGASYSVTALDEAGPRITKLRGDTQTGLPGARLLAPLVIALKDVDGMPLVGIPVAFAASPGAKIEPAAAVTDDNGEAQAAARLQSGEGIAFFTAEAAGAVVTFGARSVASSLQNFPRQMQTGTFNLGSSQAPFAQKGALLAAVSSIIRYLQNRNELPSSLGSSDPAALNDFLKNFCPLDVIGGRICDGYVSPAGPGDPVVNLWRLRDFVGGLLNVQALKGGDEGIRDALAEGRPVLLALRLTSGDTLLGSHFVAATGVDIDGSLVIHDPNPATNRTRLNDYLAGIRAAGRDVKAAVLDAVTLAPQSPSPTGFLVNASGARLAVRSRTGECGKTFDWPNAAVVGSAGIIASQTTTQLHYCEGAQAVHSLQFSGASAVLTDLGSPGRQNTVSGAGEHLVTRPTSQWQVDPMRVSVAAADIVNAATFTRDLAPGTLAAVYGTGLGRQGVPMRVEIAGREARIQSADEFRLLVEIPVEIPAGEFPLVVQSPLGSAQATVRLVDVAPFIFVDEVTRAAAVGNAGGRANTALNPAARGETVTILATGLGAVRTQGSAHVVDRSVAVVIQGVEYRVSSAVLSPELPGVYIVNVALPTEATPGLNLGLQLRVEGVDSNRVEISVR